MALASDTVAATLEAMGAHDAVALAVAKLTVADIRGAMGASPRVSALFNTPDVSRTLLTQHQGIAPALRRDMQGILLAAHVDGFTPRVGISFGWLTVGGMPWYDVLRVLEALTPLVDGRRPWIDGASLATLQDAVETSATLDYGRTPALLPWALAFIDATHARVLTTAGVAPEAEFVAFLQDECDALDLLVEREIQANKDGSALVTLMTMAVRIKTHLRSTPDSERGAQFLQASLVDRLVLLRGGVSNRQTHFLRNASTTLKRIGIMENQFAFLARVLKSVPGAVAYLLTVDDIFWTLIRSRTPSMPEARAFVARLARKFPRKVAASNVVDAVGNLDADLRTFLNNNPALAERAPLLRDIVNAVAVCRRRLARLAAADAAAMAPRDPALP